MLFLANSACSNFVSHSFSYMVVLLLKHSDNEISFDGKETFGFHWVLFKYCSNAILQLKPDTKDDTYIKYVIIIGGLNVGDFVQ